MSTSNNPLNLYATKVFAEHPIAMWSLDEDAGYISLINDTYRDLDTWSVSNAQSITEQDLVTSPASHPFGESNTSFFAASSPSGLVRLDGNSSMAISYSDISVGLGSIALSFYYYSPDRGVDINLGFTYNTEDEVLTTITIPDPNDSLADTFRVPASPRNAWAFVSKTFSFEFENLPTNFVNLIPFIEIAYDDTGLDYQFGINGITLGQWSEEFHSTSLGSTPTPLPSELSSYGDACIPALPYGLQGDSAYYVIKNQELRAVNKGMPLVFGSAGSTVITPNPSGPSLIFPDNGFLNSQFNTNSLTFEFWANIHSETVESRRIFGQLNSDNGLYVDRHLLKLVLGDAVGSYPIGSWGRPMHISIRLSVTQASVLINGEEAIQLDLSSVNVYNGEQSSGWLGMYAYDDIPVIQLEAPSVYPYEVPAIVAKRKFIYGQGVDFPTSINGLNHTSITSIDYSVANYAKVVKYPETASWSSAAVDNLSISDSSISTPEYGLPSLILSDKTDDWFTDMSATSPNTSLRVRPASGYDNVDGYFYFPTMNFLQDRVRSFLGVFNQETAVAEKQTLMRFQHELHGAIDISISDTTVSIIFEDPDSNVADLEIATMTDVSGQFVVALDLDAVASQIGGKLAAFVGSFDFTSCYIGGDSDGNTFTGDIQRFTLSNAANHQKMSSIFESNGTAISQNITIALSQNGSYTLLGRQTGRGFELDIATDSSWMDYLPLSSMTKSVQGVDGKYSQEIDFVQFNVDYVKLYRLTQDEHFDTSGLPVKTYVSFQTLSSGASAPLGSFITQPLSKESVVEPQGDEWLYTAYEVLNDTVIKMPRGAGLDTLALVVHIDIQSSGILNDNIRIKNLSLSSQAYGTTRNIIGTQYGSEMTAYGRSGQYIDFKNAAAYSMGIDTSPYLYLTHESGIRARPSLNGSDGLSIPINKNQANFFKIDLLQMSVRYPHDYFDKDKTVQLFEIEGPNDKISFRLRAASGTEKRGIVYAIDEGTQTLRSDVVFYMDGKVVKNPIITPQTWSTLSISFTNPLDFAGSPGALRITSSLSFDNVSYYQITQQDDVQRFSFRKWSGVRSGIDLSYNWEDWQNVPWQEVLFLVQTDATLSDAEAVYKTFTGTNTFIFDSTSDLTVTGFNASVYKDLVWDSFTITPV